MGFRLSRSSPGERGLCARELFVPGGSEQQSGDSSTRGPCLGKGWRGFQEPGKRSERCPPHQYPAAPRGPPSFSRRWGRAPGWASAGTGLPGLLASARWPVCGQSLPLRVQLVLSLSRPRRFCLCLPSSCSRLNMESPVQIFRGEPGPTCSPSTCLLPNGSGWLPGWAETDGNSSGGSEGAPLESAHISPAIPVIITAVYSVVFVVGLVGNSLVMFVIIR